MALGGTDYTDHYKDVFRDLIGHESQQRGSVLEQTCMIEQMEGNKKTICKRILEKQSIPGFI